MNSSECEKIQLSVMALRDGEEPTVSSEQIELHLASCEKCRIQAQELKEVDQLLNRQALRVHEADVWSGVQKQIGSTSHSVSWQPFAAIAVLLVAYKFLTMLAGETPALLLNFVPLVLMLGLFILIKENPFRINSEIMLER